MTSRPQENGGRIKASPLARRMARERGLDLRDLRGTGPEGRIVAEDVERGEARPAATRLAEARPAAAAVTDLQRAAAAWWSRFR